MFQGDNMLHTSYYNIKMIKDATSGTWGKNNFPPKKNKRKRNWGYSLIWATVYIGMCHQKGINNGVLGALSEIGYRF